MQKPISGNALGQSAIAIFGIFLFGLLHLSAKQPSPDLISLFDGASLSGWKSAETEFEGFEFRAYLNCLEIELQGSSISEYNTVQT